MLRELCYRNHHTIDKTKARLRFLFEMIKPMHTLQGYFPLNELIRGVESILSSDERSVKNQRF